ncbi:MAG: hypothetical protein E2O72_00770 [Candidatus Dadabacteria bacterium]|nr:MAG: hypothetical protein E2O72_00770 [Candidatus Dadabacteria bacterium]TDJ03276.1 MAG: hypothetical protein E2O70_00070 [Candidatus Dadabacteria bacterium]
MRELTLILLTLLIFSACSLWDKPDVRKAKWGMTKEQVKKVENAELVKEGDGILTYRIGGKASPMKVELADVVEIDEEEEVTPPEVESIGYEYDLLYVFGERGLGMVVIHLRESLDEPGHYLELFKQRTNILTKQVGEPAKGVASYKDHQVKANPYEDPAAICKGEHGLQHIWPTEDKRTNVTLELDQNKFAPEPDCNLSIFYESVEIPVDQKLSEQLHEVL